jgi:hypothetical protein
MLVALKMAVCLCTVMCVALKRAVGVCINCHVCGPENGRLCVHQLCFWMALIRFLQNALSARDDSEDVLSMCIGIRIDRIGVDTV